MAGQSSRRAGYLLTLLVLLATITSAKADCSGTFVPFDSGFSYLYTYGIYDPSTSPVSLTAEADGLFWAVGFGDAAVGAGVDSGSLPFSAWVRDDFFPSPYPHDVSFIDGNWFSDTRIDGCIASVASTDPVCMAAMISDRAPYQSNSEHLHWALATADRSAVNVFDFEQPGGAPLLLQPLPVGLNPLSYSEWNWQSTTVSLSDLSDHLFLDPACPAPEVRFKVYINFHTHGAPSPPVEFGPGWEPAIGGDGPEGLGYALDETAHIVFGCSTEEYFSDPYLAYSLLVDGEFESELVSAGVTFCCEDIDEDGNCGRFYEGDEDCDDSNPAVYFGAPEVCDGFNNNCEHPDWPSLANTGEVDDDLDGFSVCGGDCDDTSPLVAPTIAEVCDGIDNNCDGRSDEYPAILLKVVDSQPMQDGHFGVSISGLDDADGDGVGDFVVGSRWDEVDGHPQAGSATIFSGATRLALGELLHPTPQDGDNFGASVTRIGDLTGDGIGEILVGADRDDTASGVDSGSAHVFDGSLAQGFAWLAGVEDPLATAGARFGYSVAGMGVDVAGVDDYLVGARGGSSAQGSATIFRGEDHTVLQTLSRASGFVDDQYGYAVASGGDLSGNPIPELAVGAHAADSPASPGSGIVEVIDGYTHAVIHTLYDPVGVPGQSFGRSVAFVPDVTGDTIDDLIVGAPLDAAERGTVFVFSGGDGSLFATLQDPDGAVGDWFGYRVAAVDDLDGDGIGDWAISSFRDDTAAGDRAGSVSLFSAANQARLAKIVDPAGQGHNLLGASLAALPDLDGDGTGEIGAGAYLDDVAVADGGSVLLMAGAIEQDPDGDGFGNPCDDDDDGDAVLDLLDCAPLDPLYSEGPPSVGDTLLWSDGQTLSWTPAADTASYNVYRGDLGEGFNDAQCWLSEQTVPQAVEDETPVAGYYYLAVGVNPCGEGEPEPSSDGSVRQVGSVCP